MGGNRHKEINMTMKSFRIKLLHFKGMHIRNLNIIGTLIRLNEITANAICLTELLVLILDT